MAMEELVVKLQELPESSDSARFVPVLQSRKLLLLPQPCCHLSTVDFPLKVVIHIYKCFDGGNDDDEDEDCIGRGAKLKSGENS